jgi:hypothetical protein
MNMSDSKRDELTTHDVQTRCAQHVDTNNLARGQLAIRANGARERKRRGGGCAGEVGSGWPGVGAAARGTRGAATAAGEGRTGAGAQKRGRRRRPPPPPPGRGKGPPPGKVRGE